MDTQKDRKKHKLKMNWVTLEIYSQQTYLQKQYGPVVSLRNLIVKNLLLRNLFSKYGTHVWLP